MSVNAAGKSSGQTAGLVSLFSRAAAVEQPTQRADALARVWCDAILCASHGPLQHMQMQQLRKLRIDAGVLPLATLGAVRQQMMDAAARVVPNPDATHANLLAPMQALLAGMPVRSRAEQQAANVCASLHGAAQTRTLTLAPQDDAP